MKSMFEVSELMLLLAIVTVKADPVRRDSTFNDVQDLVISGQASDGELSQGERRIRDPSEQDSSEEQQNKDHVTQEEIYEFTTVTIEASKNSPGFLRSLWNSVKSFVNVETSASNNETTIDTMVQYETPTTKITQEEKRDAEDVRNMQLNQGTEMQLSTLFSILEEKEFDKELDESRLSVDFETSFPSVESEIMKVNNDESILETEDTINFSVTEDNLLNSADFAEKESMPEDTNQGTPSQVSEVPLHISSNRVPSTRSSALSNFRNIHLKTPLRNIVKVQTFERSTLLENLDTKPQLYTPHSNSIENELDEESQLDEDDKTPLPMSGVIEIEKYKIPSEEKKIDLSKYDLLSSVDLNTQESKSKYINREMLKDNSGRSYTQIPVSKASSTRSAISNFKNIHLKSPVENINQVKTLERLTLVEHLTRPSVKCKYGKDGRSCKTTKNNAVLIADDKNSKLQSSTSESRRSNLRNALDAPKETEMYLLNINSLPGKQVYMEDVIEAIRDLTNEAHQHNKRGQKLKP